MRIWLALFLLVSIAVAADVELVSDYVVSIDLAADGSAHIVKKITVMNNIDTAIVPGEGFIVLTKEEADSLFVFPTGTYTQKFQEISDLQITDSQGNVLGGKADFFKDKTVVTYEIWTPLEPGEEFSLMISYNTPDLTADGILFTPAAVPAVTGSVPIVNYEVNVKLPEGTHLTWPAGAPVENNIIHLTDKAAFVFEYSSLPFPAMPMRSSMVFWLAVIAVIIIVFLASLQKPVKKKAAPKPFVEGTWPVDVDEKPVVAKKKTKKKKKR